MKIHLNFEFVLGIITRGNLFRQLLPQVICSGSSLKPQTRSTGWEMFYFVELIAQI